MGYACPVCGDPQADGHHLANHLAFTAMLGDADHEAWLDEHVTDWADEAPEALAARVTDHAEETEYPQVFEDTTDGAGEGHEHAREHGHPSHSPGSDPGEVLDGATPAEVPDPSELFDPEASDRDAADVYAEARELTRQRRANAAAGDGEERSEGDEEESESQDADGAVDHGAADGDDS